MKLSEHFDSSEFACKCGCGGLEEGAGIDRRLVDVLENMRQFLGVPLEINSGYRCPAHNLSVGGVWNSQHTKGTAADVALPEGMDAEYLAVVAEKFGADGIGVYDWGVHVDVRGYKSRW